MKLLLMNLVFGVGLFACSTSSDKPYSYYLLEPADSCSKDMIEQPEQAKLETSRSERSIKSRWNDGATYNEVDIPVLTSGQRIIIDHKAEKSGSKKPGPEIILPGPSSTDTSHLVMHNAYISKGFLVNTKAVEVSLSKRE